MAFEINVQTRRPAVNVEILGSLEFGINGATFYPAVSEDGILSWTNDRGLPNPDPVKVTGGATEEQIAAAVESYLLQNPPKVSNGILAGGKTGQYLRKKSDEDFDVEWSDLEIPEQYGLVTYDQNKTITIT